VNVRLSPAFCLVFSAALAALTAACSGHPPVGANEGGGKTDPVPIPVPDSGVIAWDGWAGEFVNDYCVTCHNPSSTACAGNACHPANGPVPDFRVHAMVSAYAPMIRCGVAAHQDPAWKCSSDLPPLKFPVADGGTPLPSDEQRGIFLGWIDAGCP
jgi:hypothetical protein